MVNVRSDVARPGEHHVHDAQHIPCQTGRNHVGAATGEIKIVAQRWRRLTLRIGDAISI